MEFGTLRSIQKNTAYIGRNFLGISEYTFRIATALRPEFRERLCGPFTHVCIEGFPRSGNSFACYAFKRTNPDARIAHHIHIPAQIALAVKHGVPAILVVRDPLDAIASMLIADRRLSVALLVRSYAYFHARVTEHMSHVVVSEFNVTVSQLHRTVHELNNMNRTNFSIPKMTTDLQRDYRDWAHRHNQKIEQPDLMVAAPTSEKEQLKRDCQRLVKKDRKYSECRYWYEKLVEHSVSSA